MGAPTSSTRLKREDFQRTKHDSAFSQWKILIGPSDWDDHLMRKEAAEKYRTQNLPSGTPFSGVYELGILAPKRESRKLDKNSVVPVYVGQADHLRIRLQQYGRDGAHLEKGCSNNADSSLKGPGLFTQVFSGGCAIVYRYAPMESKKHAELTEKQLLDTFDYAWNKGSNGVRRHNDICKKLDLLAKASKFSLLVKKLLIFKEKQVGIKIKKSDVWGHDADKNASISQVYGIKRVLPQQAEPGYGGNGAEICGVIMDHGSICTTLPVKGRKRCALHKGMRVDTYICKSSREGKVPSTYPDTSTNSGIVLDQDSICSVVHGTDICGVTTSNGSLCCEPPIKGRKRCAVHKGMRISSREILK